MKLIKFNTETTGGSRKGEAFIRFATQGQITLSKAAVENLDLKAGDKVSIVQDEDNPDDWYLVDGDPSGFELRESTNSSLCFNNAYISKTIVEFLEIDAKSVALKVSKESSDIADKELKDCRLFWLNTKEPKYSPVKELEETA